MATGGVSTDKCRPEGSTVKLFITSYTDDFFAEREFIRREVLPELRSWCETKQLVVSEKYVKWGSIHPDRRDPTSQEKVQTSIENCYYNNVMPIFLNFTSEGVGWVPMWGECPDEHIEEYIQAYGLLMEDLEVMQGAYREDNHNSLFLIRLDSLLEKVPEMERKFLLQSTSASEKLKCSGDKIAQKFPPARLIKYHCEYKGLDSRKHTKLVFDDTLKQTILDFCKQRILFDFCGEQPQSFNKQDNIICQQHETFMSLKAASVLGRTDVIEQIEDYVFRGDRDVPLLLLGEAGLGKSSVLCKCAEILTHKSRQGQLKRSDGKSWHVFFHFVGAVPGSTNIEPMLKRLLRSMDFINDSNMPRDVNAAAQMCCSMLSNPNTQPVILLVDALNQFSEEQAAKVMSWLPRKLSPHVRCVFSSISGSQQHRTLMKRETKPIELNISPLDMATRQALVNEMLTKHHGNLSDSQSDTQPLEMTPGQKDRLLAHTSSENPLWLTVACEQLFRYETSDTLDDRIECLPEGVLNLLEELLKRFEGESGGTLIVATLCLLEASAAGLHEAELRELLADEDKLMPPAPFDEKDEKETSEKETLSTGGCVCLSEGKWSRVFSTLRPYLRPYGDSHSGRIDFYHTTLSKAVRQRYFQKKDDAVDENIEVEEERPVGFNWWHKKLADFFANVDSVDRYVEEFPHQLVCLEDSYRLGRALCDWRVFDVLYNEEFSSQILAFWRKVGSASEMISQYEEALTRYEEDESGNEEGVSVRYEKVCRIVIQAGKYHEALELLKTALKIEEKELGARPHRMVELFALMAEIYDEKLKLNDFVSPSQLPDLRKTIHYGRKSIAIRRTLPGAYHRFKLGMSLMKLAFNMESWQACGGGPELSEQDALTEGNKYIDKALKIFQELNDQGHYAEALMTKGVLAPRGCMEQLKLYNQAMDLVMQMYGEYHILTSRLYINIGIVYEDNNDFNKAYEYFKKWARVSEEILGPEHPKTLRAKGVLRETRYRSIARRMGEFYEDDDDNDDDEDDAEEDVENPDMQHYDDPITLTNNQQLIMENSLIQESGVPGVGPTLDVSPEADANVEVNGYFDENDEQNHDSGSDHENSDNENFYDDNFEDYDEQYMLYADAGRMGDEYNINILPEDDDDDDEIIQMAARDHANMIRGQRRERDNRYASDSHESSGTESDSEHSNTRNNQPD
ncbi:TPR repeat-containing protein DDB_G0287407-like [Mya arenaria]|uniref:TPR repeat-containing protein DDB_G0287407-like n=1 Tax=Mya arenaria TaxID=6604 RepID=UPI0022E1DF2D|nr:TPR repeat-containing protein DDB_G0287407-like [Mya arenaria]XP_052774112.1 TPR repeat-containing protein DDB_G0287407-like [Mya arenaria]XP_052774113.1 TPR repeat-containing protein DDB_G0287407-like [Mya arenaria]